MQAIALVISLTAIGLLALAFLWAVRNSGEAGGGARAGSFRTWLFWGLAVLGAVVTVLTLRPWPHDVAAGANPVTVTVTGHQWYWDLSREEVPVGQPIIFAVTGEKVNHGFAVYDQAGAILFQVQAMPGYVNKISYRFDTPGTYRVMCLEYCGLSHHEMAAELRAVAN